MKPLDRPEDHNFLCLMFEMDHGVIQGVAILLPFR